MALANEVEAAYEADSTHARRDIRSEVDEAVRTGHKEITDAVGNVVYAFSIEHDGSQTIYYNKWSGGVDGNEEPVSHSFLSHIDIPLTRARYNQWQMNTFTVRYRMNNGQMVERVIEARDRRDAFKFAQRHGVTPVLVQPGGVLPREGDLAFTNYTPGKVTTVDHKPWYRRLLSSLIP